MKIADRAFKRAATLAGIAAALLGAQAARADGFRPLARELASAARSQGLRRVAVLPLVPADGGRPQDGWNISEKLVTQFVRTGKVQAVERSLLQGLLEEHRLGRTGALDPAGLRKLGKLVAADCVVTGSFVTIGREVVINARLVDVETGVIVGASERRARREWFDLGNSDAETIFVPAPELTVEPPLIAPEEVSELREAPAEPCAGAALRADKLIAGVLDLKARYWAKKLREGLAAASLKHNPGSSITDPDLKRRFYERLKYWHSQDRVAGLTPAETRRFIVADGEAFSLYQQCGS